MPSGSGASSGPRWAFLNIGAEEEKGDDLRHEAYTLLQAAAEAGRIHFIGNVEANDAIMGARRCAGG